MLAVDRPQLQATVADLLGTCRVQLKARDSRGCTALLLAARSAEAKVLQLLLDAGAGEPGLLAAALLCAGWRAAVRRTWHVHATPC